jgi:hypothetical protein
MKIRHGFVSNSSSASYVLTLGIDFEEFVQNMLADFTYSIFSKRGFTCFIKKQIEMQEKFVKETRSEIKEAKDKNRLELHKIWLKESEDKVKYYNQLLKDMDLMSAKELVLSILKENNIKLTVCPRNRIELRTWTIMFNDMCDFGELIHIIAGTIASHDANIKIRGEVFSE